MAIDLNDVINDLNGKAKELLESASDLDTVLSKVFYKPGESLESIHNHMSNLCRVMGDVIGILENKNTSPLNKFMEKTQGVFYSPDSDNPLEDFLKAHEKRLRELDVKQELIDKLLEYLNKKAEGTMEHPVSVGKKSNEFVARDSEIVKNLNYLRGSICSAAEKLEMIVGFLDKGSGLLKSVVKGAMGAATVIVDITSVFSIPDINGGILYTAVKSTKVGGYLVVESFENIKNTVTEFENEERLRQEKLEAEQRAREEKETSDKQLILIKEKSREIPEKFKFKPKSEDKNPKK